MPDTHWITMTGEMLQGIGAVLGPVAVGVAAWFGSRTFEGWRQQNLSERRIEQAERILTATYKARRGLSYVRSPSMMQSELNAAETALKVNGEWNEIGGSEGERERFVRAQAYYNRLDRTLEDRRLLEECQPMARALFGEALEEALEMLNSQFWAVKVYVDANLQDRDMADAAFAHKIDSVIYEGYPTTEENEVDQAIAAEVRKIEDICVPVLRLEGEMRKGTKLRTCK